MVYQRNVRIIIIIVVVISEPYRSFVSGYTVNQLVRFEYGVLDIYHFIMFLYNCVKSVR